MRNMRAIFTLSVLCCLTSISAVSQNGLKQLAVLEPSNAGRDDFFGTSVSQSGNVIVVDGGSGTEYVFVEPAGGWTDSNETATLTTSDGTLLGMVAVSGDTIAALGEDGTAYVFVKPSTGWANMTQTAKLTASDGGVFVSVGVSGNTLVAGAYTPSALGAAYVFVEPKGGWQDMTQNAELTGSDSTTTDRFGVSVAVSGPTIVVGASYATTYQMAAGAAYVFAKPLGGWVNATETGKLTASDGSFDGSLGASVAVTGTAIVAGAPYQTDNSIFVYGGAAYVFVEPPSGWTTSTETAKLIASNGVPDGLMGYSVSMSGNIIAAGSPGRIDLSLRQAAYEFVKPAGGWVSATQSTSQAPTKGSAYAEFGYAIATSGSTVVVGAPGSAFNSFEGSVYVYGP